MIKIANYTLCRELREIYGPGDILIPENFYEYIEMKNRLQQVREDFWKSTLFLPLLSEAKPVDPDMEPVEDSDEEDFPAPHKIFGTEEGGMYDPQGNLRTSQYPSISGENIIYDWKDVRFLSQFPMSAWGGVMGRTRYGMDMDANRYLGYGLYGALAFRLANQLQGNHAQLSNYSVEIRFLKAGKPQGDPNLIFDPVTLNTIPNMGAIVAPSRAAQLVRGKASKNPHQGYLYDGLSDPDRNGHQTPLAKGGKFSEGVFTGYRDVVNKIETPLGAPRGRISTGAPLRKVGKVGTSLEPPIPGVVASYFGLEGLKPSASGYGNLALQSGGRMTHGEKRSGGASTWFNIIQRWIQKLAENPELFNQRLNRFLLGQERQHQAGQRGPTGLLTHPPGTPIDRVRHIAPTDSGEPYRSARYPVEQDPTRHTVQPAIRVPMDPAYRQRLIDHYTKMRDQYLTPEAIEKAKQEQIQKYGPLDSYQEEQWERAKQNPESFIRYWQQALDRITKDVTTEPTLKKQDFSTGYAKEMVPTDDPYATGKTFKHPVTGEKYKTKLKIGKRINPETGEEENYKVKQKHEIPAREVTFKNLYSLTPAKGRAVVISEKLANAMLKHQNEKDFDSNRAREDILKFATKTPGDQLVVKHFGARSRAQGKPVVFLVKQTNSGKGAEYNIVPLGAKKKNEVCRWAMVDEHDEVMFVYNKDKNNTDIHPQLSPGILDDAMGNNPTAFGGHQAAPQGTQEQFPYESEERFKRSLFGKSGKPADINADPSDWGNGMDAPIRRNISWGVDYYLKYGLSRSTNLSESVKKAMRSPENRDELINDAYVYILFNLKNGKMWDFSEGHDVHINMLWTQRQFKYLFASLKKLDQLIDIDGDNLGAPTDDGKPKNPNNRYLRATQMTMTQLKAFLLNLKHLQDTDQIGKHLFPINIRTNYIASPESKDRIANGAHPVKYNRIFRRNIVSQLNSSGRLHRTNDENGDPIFHNQYEDPKEHQSAELGGMTKLYVDARDILEMIDKARQWYVRWSAKDIVKRTLDKQYMSKQARGQRGRGGVADQDAIDIANQIDDLGNRIKDERSRGKGYSRYNGQLATLFKDIRTEYAKQYQRYLQAIQKSKENLMDEDALVDKAANRVLYIERWAEFHSLNSLVKSASLKGLTGKDAYLYIAEHYPHQLLHALDKIDLGEMSTPLDIAAAPEKKIKTETWQEVMEQLKNRSEGYYKDKDYIQRAEQLILGTPKQQHQVMNWIETIYEAGYDLYGGKKDDQVPLEQVEAAVSYRAIEAMDVLIHDEDDPAKVKKVEDVIKKLVHSAQLPEFTYAARQMLEENE